MDGKALSIKILTTALQKSPQLHAQALLLFDTWKLDTRSSRYVPYVNIIRSLENGIKPKFFSCGH